MIKAVRFVYCMKMKCFSANSKSHRVSLSMEERTGNQYIGRGSLRIITRE